MAKKWSLTSPALSALGPGCMPVSLTFLPFTTWNVLFIALSQVQWHSLSKSHRIPAISSAAAFVSCNCSRRRCFKETKEKRQKNYCEIEMWKKWHFQRIKALISETTESYFVYLFCADMVWIIVMSGEFIQIQRKRFSRAIVLLLHILLLFHFSGTALPELPKLMTASVNFWAFRQTICTVIIKITRRYWVSLSFMETFQRVELFLFHTIKYGFSFITMKSSEIKIRLWKLSVALNVSRI